LAGTNSEHLGLFVVNRLGSNDADPQTLGLLKPANPKHWHIFHIVARKSAAR